MNLVSLLIILLAITITYWKPSAGLVVAANAPIIRRTLTIYTGTENEDILLSLLLPIVVFLIILIRAFKNLSYYRIHHLDILFILLGIWFLISSLIASDIFRGVEITFRYFVLGISFYFCARLIPLINMRILNKNLSLLALSTWISAFLVAIISLYQGIYNGFNVDRLTIGTANPIPVSLLLSMGLIVNAYWLTIDSRANFILRFFNCLGIPILGMALIANKTRSVIIALVLSFIFIILTSKYRNSLIKYLAKIIIIIMTLAIVFYLLSHWQPEIFSSWMQRFSRLQDTNTDISGSKRISLYGYALYLFSQNILFGVGTANFGVVSKTAAYPHNLVLEIASEQGTFGLIILSLIIFTITGILGRRENNIYKYPIKNLFSAWIILNFTVAQFSLTLWQHKNLFLTLGLLVSVHQYYSTISQTNIHKMVEIKKNIYF
ncbi:MAG: O-antigen ligase family protein [Cyanobacteria bacterium J06621_15]